MKSQEQQGRFKTCPESVEGKTAGVPGLRSHFGGVGLARGAYREYVSTTKGRPACALARCTSYSV